MEIEGEMQEGAVSARALGKGPTPSIPFSDCRVAATPVVRAGGDPVGDPARD